MSKIKNYYWNAIEYLGNNPVDMPKDKEVFDNKPKMPYTRSFVEQYRKSKGYGNKTTSYSSKVL